MNNFKRGDKVKRVRGHKYYTLFQHNVGAVFTVAEVSDYEGIRLEECTEGSWFDDEKFELYQEPAQKTFNPKPGDTIVTENNGTYECVTQEAFRERYAVEYKRGGSIIGIKQSGRFQDWNSAGIPVSEYVKVSENWFNIKEIIPASGNNPVAISQSPQDLSFQVKALELENQMLRKLLRREGVEV